MTPLEATDLLRRKSGEDNDVKMMIAVVVSRAGHPDLYEWAADDPDGVVRLAEEVLSIEEQEAEMDRRLAAGDLS